MDDVNIIEEIDVEEEWERNGKPGPLGEYWKKLLKHIGARVPKDQCVVSDRFTIYIVEETDEIFRQRQNAKYHALGKTPADWSD